MMPHYYAQTVVDSGALVPVSLDQVVQQRHQDLYLPARVCHEYRGQTARRRGDVVRNQREQTMNTEHDLVSGTGLGIEEYVVAGIGERPADEAAVDLSSGGQWQDRVVRQSAGVQEKGAQRGESAARQRIFQHDLTMVLVPHRPPIILNVVNALAEGRGARPEVAVLDRGSQAETDRPKELDLHVDVLLAEQGVQTGGYQDEAQGGQAHDN